MNPGLHPGLHPRFGWRHRLGDPRCLTRGAPHGWVQPRRNATTRCLYPMLMQPVGFCVKHATVVSAKCTPAATSADAVAIPVSIRLHIAKRASPSTITPFPLFPSTACQRRCQPVVRWQVGVAGRQDGVPAPGAASVGGAQHPGDAVPSTRGRGAAELSGAPAVFPAQQPCF